MSTSEHAASSEGSFRTTRWTLVRRAGEGGGEPARAALAELCAMYWYPLYAFVRRRGHNAHDAADLTQGFFARMLEKNNLSAADATRGRFRSFLLSSLTHFLCNESDRSNALKRGGGLKHVPFEPHDAESRYQSEPADDLTPEKLFDRQWAVLLLERALLEVRSEYERLGSARVFDVLKSALTFAPDASSYRTIADELGMTEGAVKVAVHRLRDRYRQRLRSIILDSVTFDQDVEDEIRHLFHAFAAHA